MTTHPTADLATFLAGVRYESLPAATRERVVDIILDTVASAIAGRAADETVQIEGLANALGGPKRTSVIAGPPGSLAGATLTNGYQVTALSLCDIHRPTRCHITPAVVPPALALAEERDASGRDLLTAVAVGLESAVRIGAGMGPALRERGWHAPGVIGPFGGAAAVASLLGFDATRFRHALALAGTQAAGTLAQWGTPTIKFHQSRAGLSGLLAGLLAEQGFPGGAEILAADHGGLFHLYTDGGDVEALLAGLGERWALEEISLRPWPAASSIQSLVTALLALVDQHDLSPGAIERVEVGLSETVCGRHGSLPFDTGLSAQFSAPYVTAVVVHDRRCGFEQFAPARLGDPALAAFIEGRTRVAVDDSVEGTGAAVTIHTTDGRVLNERRAYPHGDAADPLRREEIIAKLRDCARDRLDADATERVIEMLAGLADLPRVRDLCAVLSRPHALAEAS